MVGDKVLVNGIGGNFIPGGQTVGNQFYKCASYTPATPGGEDQNKIIVSGSTIAAADINGIYEIEDSTQTGESRVWKHQTQYYWIVWDEVQAFWVIASAKLAIAPSDWFAISYGDVISDIWTDAADLSVVEGMETAYATTPSTPASWTGYKAVLSQGVYSFESTLTTDPLTCSNVTLIPMVGGVYTADALIRVSDLYTGIPTDYLIYAKLDSATSTIETGQTMVIERQGGFSYSSFAGIPAAYTTSSVILQINQASTPITNFSYSIWLKPNRTSTSQFTVSFRNSGGNLVASSRLKFGSDCYADWSDTNKWNHVVCTYDDSSKLQKIYVNGVLEGFYTNTGSLAGNLTTVYLGGDPSYGSTDYSLRGYFANFKFYDRVLTDAEIAGLANELTPVYS